MLCEGVARERYACGARDNAWRAMWIELELVGIVEHVVFAAVWR